LTVAVAKRPDLLVLDEPAASLDPLARREFLSGLMEAVTDQQLTVVLSSHLLGDVERVCDHLVVLDRGRVRLAGDVDDLLAADHPRGSVLGAASVGVGSLPGHGAGAGGLQLLVGAPARGLTARS
jgi:ABC-2 type transport system ATP-binding protein